MRLPEDGCVDMTIRRFLDFVSETTSEHDIGVPHGQTFPTLLGAKPHAAHASDMVQVITSPTSCSAHIHQIEHAVLAVGAALYWLSAAFDWSCLPLSTRCIGQQPIHCQESARVNTLFHLLTLLASTLPRSYCSPHRTHVAACPGASQLP